MKIFAKLSFLVFCLSFFFEQTYAAKSATCFDAFSIDFFPTCITGLASDFKHLSFNPFKIGLTMPSVKEISTQTDEEEPEDTTQRGLPIKMFCNLLSYDRKIYFQVRDTAYALPSALTKEEYNKSMLDLLSTATTSSMLKNSQRLINAQQTTELLQCHPFYDDCFLDALENEAYALMNTLVVIVFVLRTQHYMDIYIKMAARFDALQRTSVQSSAEQVFWHDLADLYKALLNSVDEAESAYFTAINFLIKARAGYREYQKFLFHATPVTDSLGQELFRALDEKCGLLEELDLLLKREFQKREHTRTQLDDAVEIINSIEQLHMDKILPFLVMKNFK